MTPQRAWRLSCSPLVMLVVVIWGAACARVDLGPEDMAQLGHFTVLEATPTMRGVVFGVPHAELAPGAVAAARKLHESAGVGIVLAQGFMGSHAIAVTFPAEGQAVRWRDLAQTTRARSVYHKYVRALRRASGGEMGLYLELREARTPGKDIEVATVGVSRHEAAKIKTLRMGMVSARVEPIDTLTDDPWGTKHNGVLLLPPKGLLVQFPQTPPIVEADVAEWLRGVVGILTPVSFEAIGRPAVLDRGRFSVVKRSSPIVVAAPHGSGDPQSDYFAELIAERLDASLIVVHGFVGTTALFWRDRIAVNRLFEGPGVEVPDTFTSEAEVVYHSYVERVKALAAWPPALYIEVHTSGHIKARGTIEVATVGISNGEALRIKRVYQEVAARMLGRHPDVGLRIEPADVVFFNAQTTKKAGILREMPRALHIELPAYEVIRDRSTREVYAEILTEVFQQASSFLLPSR